MKDSKKTCLLCGKKFSTKTKGYFHARVRLYHLDWYTYEMIKKGRKYEFKPVFKNKLIKFLCYTELQRNIVYYLWYPFKGWQKWDYWECHKCCKE